MERLFCISVRLLRSLEFMKVGEEQVSFYKDAEGKDIYFTGFGYTSLVRRRKVMKS